MVDRPHDAGIGVSVEPPSDCVDISADDSEQIVEVMGNATSQLVYRLHLLGLPERFFGAQTLVDLCPNPSLECIVELAQFALSGFSGANVVDDANQAITASRPFSDDLAAPSD